MRRSTSLAGILTNLPILVKVMRRSSNQRRTHATVQPSPSENFGTDSNRVEVFVMVIVFLLSITSFNAES
jgi:hypothetical protein